MKQQTVGSSTDHYFYIEYFFLFNESNFAFVYIKQRCKNCALMGQLSPLNFIRILRLHFISIIHLKFNSILIRRRLLKIRGGNRPFGPRFFIRVISKITLRVFRWQINFKQKGCAGLVWKLFLSPISKI